MSFVQAVNAKLTQYKAGLRKAAAKQKAAATRKTKAQMKLAETKAAKFRLKAALDAEKARIYTELVEAETAAVRAATALKRARMEAGDLTASEKFDKVLKRGSGVLAQGVDLLMRGASWRSYRKRKEGIYKTTRKSSRITPKRPRIRH